MTLNTRRNDDASTHLVGSTAFDRGLRPNVGGGGVATAIAGSDVGRFARGGSWYLSMNSAGKAQLTIAPSVGQSQWIRREFDVTTEQLADFRKLLDDESFFELADEYGQRVPDGSTQTLTVIQGDRAKSVKVRFLMNWVAASDKDKLNEPSRALRLLVLIRGWFADPEAVDLRSYNQKVLDAVK